MEYLLKHLYVMFREWARITSICNYAMYYFVKHHEERKLLALKYQNANLEERFRKALEEEKKRGHNQTHKINRC